MGLYAKKTDFETYLIDFMKLIPITFEALREGVSHWPVITGGLQQAKPVSMFIWTAKY